MRNRSFPGLALVVCLLVVSVGLSAQTPAKRPISYDAYDGWKTIQGTKISRDGTWLVYVLSPQDGDSQLVVRNLKTGAESRQPRGREPVITADDKFVVFTIAPVKAEVDKAKKEKKKPEEQPKGGVGALNLATGQVFTSDRVKSFKVAEESGRFVAYLLEAPEKKADAKPETKPEAKPEAKPEPGASKKPKEKKKDPGTELVIRDLAAGTDTRVAEVVEYVWAEDGSWLVYGTSSDAKTPEKDGAFARRASDGVTKTLLSGLGHYKTFAFDEKAGQLAFLSDRDTYKENPALYKLYYWTPAAETASEIASGTAKGMPTGMVVSENGRPEFSRDGSRLFFGYAKPPAPEPAEDAAEPVKVDIWSWTDPLLQPMQKVQADAEKKRSYRAAINLKDKSLLPLASEDMPDLTIVENAPIALGASDVPYRQMISWDAEHNDYYAVSLQDGSRKKLIEKSRFPATLSPGGAYLLNFNADDSQWYTVRVSDGAKTNLTAKLGVRFDDESSDTPEPARAYGAAGWTPGDRSVLLYDKYDIWEVRPDGTDARIVTGGAGRKAQIVFRYVRTDPDERTVPTDKPFLLSAVNDVTKATGYYRVTPTAAAPAPAAKSTKPAKGKAATPAPAALTAGYGEPAKLVMLDKRLASPTTGGGPGGGPGGGGAATLLKPKNADGPFILTASRFEEFPNLWTAGPNFENLTKVSDANPQQADYVWGRSELIEYLNADGKTLRAVLTKPENFDPARKYPLMVYIYEELTNGLHSYATPQPGTSINLARYVSNGYILLQPDIVYTTGYPGEDAFKCVVPAVLKVVGMGFIDPARIGIQGHSWGGFQITYLITRTDMFRAVEAGASVSNMVSAYGGIRWGTGMSRAFQYERTQSRIGAPPWIRSLQFIENSPIFWVEKVNTPYLTIHNDEDDAVPWYQGIEFYSALRRLGKPAWMFNFNTEKHGLRERENQKYWTIHLDEFFDHYLLGKPRPEWMEKGVPYLERGKRDVSGYYGKK